MSKRKGWEKESARHSLAAKGVKTKKPTTIPWEHYNEFIMGKWEPGAGKTSVVNLIDTERFRKLVVSPNDGITPPATMLKNIRGLELRISFGILDDKLVLQSQIAGADNYGVIGEVVEVGNKWTQETLESAIDRSIDLGDVGPGMDPKNSKEHAMTWFHDEISDPGWRLMKNPMYAELYDIPKMLR